MPCTLPLLGKRSVIIVVTDIQSRWIYLMLKIILTFSTKRSTPCLHEALVCWLWPRILKVEILISLSLLSSWRHWTLWEKFLPVRVHIPYFLNIDWNWLFEALLRVSIFVLWIAVNFFRIWLPWLREDTLKALWFDVFVYLVCNSRDFGGFLQFLTIKSLCLIVCLHYPKGASSIVWANCFH